jgi:ABC-type transport system involved in multi-copper enzyme maturation permease subunit
MLGNLILKRMRLNILSLRFLYSLVLMVGLAALSGVITSQDLKTRMQYAQARESEWKSALETARTYNTTYGQAILMPPTLNVIAEGVGDRFGMIARVFGQFGGVRVGGRAQSNRLLALLPMDLSHIVGLILSLVAILLTYDSISGDRESGTLRLILSYRVARSTLFISEYLAAVITVVVVLAPAVLAWLLAARTTGLVSFTPDEWGRLTVFLIAIVLFISIYVTTGLVVSSMLRESVTSLMWGLLIWVVSTSLYPSLAAWSAIQIKPIRSNPHMEERTTLNQMIEQARMARSLQLISPVYPFYALASRIADTDLETYLQFLKYADRYQEQVTAWHGQKLSQYPERASRWSSGSDLLDIDSFPQPTPKAAPLTQQVASSFLFLSLLIVFNALLVLTGLLAVNRYDPR